jgi:hypothetical protein
MTRISKNSGFFMDRQIKVARNKKYSIFAVQYRGMEQ